MMVQTVSQTGAILAILIQKHALYDNSSLGLMTGWNGASTTSISPCFFTLCWLSFSIQVMLFRKRVVLRTKNGKTKRVRVVVTSFKAIDPLDGHFPWNCVLERSI